MSPITRRDFFLKTLRPANSGKNLATTEIPEFIIGRVVDFPLGEKILHEPHQVIIESLPEGLRAQSTENKNQFYSIKLNQIGELIVNRMEIWSADQVFSILTNEPAYLDISSEDRE
jgi:hypothetical protein